MIVLLILIRKDHGLKEVPGLLENLAALELRFLREKGRQGAEGSGIGLQFGMYSKTHSADPNRIPSTQFQGYLAAGNDPLILRLGSSTISEV